MECPRSACFGTWAPAWSEIGRTSWLAAAEEAGRQFEDVSSAGASGIEEGTFGSAIDERDERLVIRLRPEDAQVVAEPGSATA